MKPLNEIRQWLQERIAEEIRARPETISAQIPFANYGLDSIVIVTIVADLEEWLEIDLDPTIFWEYPTIETLSEWLFKADLPQR
jgi:acyl carrier protein